MNRILEKKKNKQTKKFFCKASHLLRYIGHYYGKGQKKEKRQKKANTPKHIKKKRVEEPEKEDSDSIAEGDDDSGDDYSENGND